MSKGLCRIYIGVFLNLRLGGLLLTQFRARNFACLFQ